MFPETSSRGATEGVVSDKIESTTEDAELAGVTAKDAEHAGVTAAGSRRHSGLRTRRVTSDCDDANSPISAERSPSEGSTPSPPEDGLHCKETFTSLSLSMFEIKGLTPNGKTPEYGHGISAVVSHRQVARRG